MKLTGDLKKQVEKAESKDEKKSLKLLSVIYLG